MIADTHVVHFWSPVTRAVVFSTYAVDVIQCATADEFGSVFVVTRDRKVSVYSF